MRVRCGLLTVLATTGLLLVGSPASSALPQAGGTLLPTSFALPDGFQPEGIAIGTLPLAYFGSRANGDIFRVNLLTGQGDILSKGPGTPSLGLKTDWRGRLFVAGGTGGDGRVIDIRSGDVLAEYHFATGTSFVNDVVLTGDAAWFTDSVNAVLYQVPLGRAGGLPDASAVVHLPLTGDMVMAEGNNANGIVRTPDGSALLIVQSNTGKLFRVDPATGVTTEVDLGGFLLTNGDGLLLQGRTLYAVQNRLNLIAVLRLDATGTSGQLVEQLTDDRFDVPTTVAAFADRLYLPNARFTTPPTPTTSYNVVAVRRP